MPEEIKSAINNLSDEQSSDNLTRTLQTHNLKQFLMNMKNIPEVRNCKHGMTAKIWIEYVYLVQL